MPNFSNIKSSLHRELSGLQDFTEYDENTPELIIEEESDSEESVQSTEEESKKDAERTEFLLIAFK